MAIHKKEIMEHRWVDKDTGKYIDGTTWKGLSRHWDATVIVTLEPKMRGGAEPVMDDTTTFIFKIGRDVACTQQVALGMGYRNAMIDIMTSKPELLDYRWVNQNTGHYVDMVTWKSLGDESCDEIQLRVEPKMRGGADDVTDKMRQKAEKILVSRTFDEPRAKALLDAALRAIGSAAFRTAFVNLNPQAGDGEVWSALKKVANGLTARAFSPGHPKTKPGERPGHPLMDSL